MKKQIKSYRNLGFSMFEVLLMLGITMGIMVAGIAKYASYSTQTIVNSIAYDIQNGKETSVKLIGNKEFLISPTYQKALCYNPLEFLNDFKTHGITLQMKTQDGKKTPPRPCTEQDIKEGIQWVVYADEININSKPEKNQENAPQLNWSSEEKL